MENGKWKMENGKKGKHYLLYFINFVLTSLFFLSFFLFYIIMSAKILPSDVPSDVPRNHRNQTFKNMKKTASNFLNKLTRPKTSNKIYIGDDIPISDNTLGIEDIDINLGVEDKKTGGKRRRTRQLRQKSRKNKRRTRRTRRNRRNRR